MSNSKLNGTIASDILLFSFVELARRRSFRLFLVVLFALVLHCRFLVLQTTSVSPQSCARLRRRRRTCWYSALQNWSVIARTSTMDSDVHQIDGVALSFREFHGVHALPSVPMQVSATFVHRGELDRRVRKTISTSICAKSYLSESTLEQLLHSGGVRQARRRLSLSDGRHRAQRHRHVVGNPLHPLRRVLVLEVIYRLLWGSRSVVVARV